MVEHQEKVISTLNKLIETCKDGEEGFRNAAEHMKTTAHKELCIQYSQQRAQFASELTREVQRLGGGPQKSASVSASLHRGWMDVKSAVTGKDDAAILAECERGEETALERYDEKVCLHLHRDRGFIFSN